MKKKQRILYKKIAVVVCGLLVVFLGRAVLGGFGALESAQERQDDQSEKFSKLDERIVYLENRIDFLDTQEGLEQEILETFPVKRAGEKVTILIEQDEEGSGFFRRPEEKKWWEFWKK